MPVGSAGLSSRKNKDTLHRDNVQGDGWGNSSNGFKCCHSSKAARNRISRQLLHLNKSLCYTKITFCSLPNTQRLLLTWCTVGLLWIWQGARKSQPGHFSMAKIVICLMIQKCVDVFFYSRVFMVKLILWCLASLLKLSGGNNCYESNTKLDAFLCLCDL